MIKNKIILPLMIILIFLMFPMKAKTVSEVSIIKKDSSYNNNLFVKYSQSYEVWPDWHTEELVLDPSTLRCGPNNEGYLALDWVADTCTTYVAKISAKVSFVPIQEAIYKPLVNGTTYTCLRIGEFKTVGDCKSFSNDVLFLRCLKTEHNYNGKIPSYLNFSKECNENLIKTEKFPKEFGSNVVCGGNTNYKLVTTGTTGDCIIPTTETTVKKITMIGNTYKDNMGNTGYAIHSGRKYTDEREYYLDSAFNTKTCLKSNSSLDCGLASIVTEGTTRGYDYATILTSLRLWNAYRTKGTGDGWYYDGKTITSSAFYYNTANLILSENYNGETEPSKTKRIWGTESIGITTVKNAFGLFKECAAGTLPVVNSKITADKTNVNFKTGTATIIVKTPFSDETTIDVKTDNSKVAIDSVTRRQNGSDYELMVVVRANNSDCKIKEFGLLINASGPNSSVSKAKRLLPQGGTKYTSMVVYDPNSSGGSSTTLHFDVDCNSLGTCPTALEVKIDAPEDCIKDGNIGQIIDPTIDEILDSCRDSGPENVKRELYNVTTKYSKLNSYARLYCREEAEITFFDIDAGKSGMYFEHDLPGKIAGNISSVIVDGKKECETIIDYTKWKTEFEAAQDKVIEKWNDMKKWEALKDSPKGARTVSKTISSLATCCGTVDETCINKSGSTIQKCCDDWKSGVSTTCSAIVYTWGSASHTVCSRSGCSSTSSTASSGAPSGSCSTCDQECSCNDGDGSEDYANQQYTSAVSAYNSARKAREQLYIDIQNYNLYTTINVVDSSSGADITNLQTKIVNTYANEYKSALGDVEYADEKNGKTVKIASKVGTTNTYYEAPSYCVGCTKTDAMGANATETLKYYLCSDSGCKPVNIEVPKNTRATMQTSIEADYYQDQKYYQQAYTGDVAAGNAPSQNYVPLKEHIFPIDVKVKSGLYPITAKYEDIIARFEKASITKETDYSGVYKCYYNAYNEILEYPPSSPLGFIFRQIDLKSIFPNVRVKGANWSTTDASRVIKEVQTLGDDLWITSSPDYSFTLTPSDRRKIKSYNADKASLGVGYTDMSLVCEAGNIKCKSTFLDKTSISEYISDYKTINGRSTWR